MASDASAEMKAAKHGAYLNGKYHADRESFLDFWDRAITFTVLVSGATAFLDVAGAGMQRLSASILAIFALLQLVFALPKQARQHAVFKERYFEIAAQLDVGEILVPKASAEMMKLAGRESSPYMALHALAENWATTAVYGLSRKLPCRVSLIRRYTANVWRYSSARFSS